MGQNFDHKRIPLKSNMRLPRQLGQMSGESVLKCSFSVNLAGRRSVIACGGTQLEIRSELLYEYCCSSFLLDIHALCIQRVQQELYLLTAGNLGSTTTYY